MTPKGTYRIRKTGNEYVIEELNKHGSWVLSEILPCEGLAVYAYAQYIEHGHTVKWFV